MKLKHTRKLRTITLLSQIEVKSIEILNSHNNSHLQAETQTKIIRWPATSIQLINFLYTK